jgi:hypothetical protein
MWCQDKRSIIKDSLHLQTPPNLWSASHQSSLTTRQNEHRPLGAHTRVLSVITPTSPPQYPDDELMSLDEYISQMKPTYTAIHTKLAQPKFLQATRDPLLLPPLKLRNPES